MNARCKAALVATALLALGCRGSSHGHDHGDHGDHGGDHREDEGPEPIAITRWADGHELFVELDPPQPGKPVGYHAHITHLDGFQPATKGTFVVQFRRGDEVVAEARANEVARAGIFTPRAAAPPAGTYQLTMTFVDGMRRAEFDCGRIVIGDEPSSEGDAEVEAALSFLKEQQWKVPFGTAWAGERLMAREIELPAVVEAPGADQLTIASPTGGRFFHRDEVALAEGIVLEKGTVIGSISP
ncbi:MAG: hypothetical protein RIF41_33455, partial [Polyangiaceae bacterium]